MFTRPFHSFFFQTLTVVCYFAQCCRHVACEAKRKQRKGLFLPKPNLPLRCNKRLTTTTYNNYRFQDSSKATMDNEASMETKTNDDEYIPFESIIYSLKVEWCITSCYVSCISSYICRAR
jgi:hypothetical protein